MAKLSTKQRKAMPAKAFAGPDRSYPVNDRSHAANAKARASAQVNAGRMAPATEAKIDAKANKVLGKGKSLPERGERTATNKRTRSEHPGSHDAWEALGRD
jgi:hypothetical protein